MYPYPGPTRWILWDFLAKVPQAWDSGPGGPSQLTATETDVLVVPGSLRVECQSCPARMRPNAQQVPRRADPRATLGRVLIVC
jgi:hypothetical protein